jgi:hypothetical protein
MDSCDYSFHSIEPLLYARLRVKLRVEHWVHRHVLSPERAWKLEGKMVR